MANTSLAQLIISMATKPIIKYCLDFIGPIKCIASTTRIHYILVAMDYATKWVKARALKTNVAPTNVDAE